MIEFLIKLLHAFWSDLVVGQIQQLGAWNYVLLAVLVAVEGPITTLLGAIAASTGLLCPEWVFLAASTGNLAADTFWYLLGYLGKTNWLLRPGSRLGLRRAHIQRLERGMNAHARKILVTAKLTLSFAIPALIAAGLARVPWRRWFPAVAAAEVVWTGGLVLIGYNFALSLKRLEEGLQVVAIAGAVVFTVMLVRYLTRHSSRLKPPVGQSKEQPPGETPHDQST